MVAPASAGSLAGGARRTLAVRTVCGRQCLQHHHDAAVWRAVGCGWTHLRPFDALSRSGLGTEYRPWHMCRLGHDNGSSAAQHVLSRTERLGGAHLFGCHGRCGDAGGHSHNRNGGKHEGGVAVGRREEGGREGLQLHQGTCHSSASRIYERMLQRRTDLRRRHKLRTPHSRHVQDAACHDDSYSGRISYQRRLLLQSERPQQHVGRLQEIVGVGKQRLLLSCGRCLVVQPVLRPVAGQGFPC